jgi:hypothetical protein
VEDQERAQRPRECAGREEAGEESTVPDGKPGRGDLPPLRTTQMPLPSVVIVLRNEQA